MSSASSATTVGINNLIFTIFLFVTFYSSGDFRSVPLLFSCIYCLTGVVDRLEELLDELLLVLEASEGGDAAQDVVVDGLAGGDDVGLDDLHHGRFQLQLALDPRDRPRVVVHVLQLEKKGSKNEDVSGKIFSQVGMKKRGEFGVWKSRT